MAIGRPPSLGIDVIQTTIQQKLAEVGAEAMLLLHGRSREIFVDVRYLRNKNEDQFRQIKSLNNNIKSLELQNEELLSTVAVLRERSEQMQMDANRRFP